MTSILFYGVPSGCSFGSIVALEWLGEPYRLCRIQMPEVASGDDFRRINPAGETPAFMTGGGQVFSESMAILNHIAARGIGRGIGHPQGTPEFDRLNQVLAFLNTSFFNAFSPLWHAYEHAGDGEEQRVLRAYGTSAVELAHATLEAMLGDRPWLLGAQRSVADAYFAGIARWTEYHDVVDRRDYPNVQRLYERLQQEPAVAFAHAIERGEPARSSGGFLGEISLEEVLR